MCSLEFSDLEPSFWQRYNDRGLVVVGLDAGGLYGLEHIDLLRQFRQQTGVTFPIGWDRSQSYRAFRGGLGDSISPFPLDVVIDRDGRIAYMTREYRASELAAVIERLLD